VWIWNKNYFLLNTLFLCKVIIEREQSKQLIQGKNLGRLSKSHIFAVILFNKILLLLINISFDY
ncbi:MAG TPA: hypothetical protein VHF08_05005, partial [Nitrososphaeraceae archaeon]|nr:hypothetical protein [Nitrososphaeraceae archaeon]